MSQDPLGLLAGENVYCYPWNSFGYTDPLGLCPENKVLYRGERASTTPDKVFENGFVPKGTHNDPLLHTQSNATAGNFISTTNEFNIADGFAGKNGYVYVVETNNYVDINKAYGSKELFPEQSEFSIPGGIKASEIKGAFIRENGKITGEFIENLNFGGN